MKFKLSPMSLIAIYVKFNILRNICDSVIDGGKNVEVRSQL
jgi:hypothetical protein